MRSNTKTTDSLLEQYPTKTVPLSKQEEKRIYDMALKKIETLRVYGPDNKPHHQEYR